MSQPKLALHGIVKVDIVDMEKPTIPYTAWGDTEKVSLRIASLLTFHDLSTMSAPAESVQTSWINYVFESEAGTYCIIPLKLTA